ncbi:MAG: 16S rRNA (adenine(1518)-N(6)/adenine(1519)-N(6))-dimethyltransferase RsmA [Acetobacteraceae bacterium]|nr:16S rRNA (adenine(1518)-N(6)/adenine(1519)-N(6))-dimethyltransferase RsmA [Acetobacteraceae bacterium]
MRFVPTPGPPDSSPSAWPPLREVIARHGLTARRSLGQHFLMDKNLIARSVGCAGDLQRRQVVEVGPGPGGLTRGLLDAGAAQLVAIELDPRAATATRELIPFAGGRLAVIEADALKLDAATLVQPPRQIVANLPYNVATPLLIGWLRQAGLFEQMTLMFQQEVAERICAAPGAEAYGRLSVLAQWLCEAEIVVRIPPRAFVPPPRVWSAVVRLRPQVEQPEPSEIRAMERLTEAAFGQRRKMLRSSLRALGGEELLAEVDIAPSRRAEMLTVAEYARLCRALASNRPTAWYGGPGSPRPASRGSR